MVMLRNHASLTNELGIAGLVPWWGRTGRVGRTAGRFGSRRIIILDQSMFCEIEENCRRKALADLPLVLIQLAD
jgi:hypothetical protein